jgi:class 3 adenylate cyclase
VTDPVDREPKKDESSKETSHRFDFTFEVVSMNDETGEFELSMKPNPARYEWRTVDGEQRLYDRFDNVYFDPDVFRQFAEQIGELPITFEAPHISDAAAYVRSRQHRVEAMLDGDFRDAGFADKSEEFLEALAGDRLGFVILSIDIVGSTALATSSAGDEYHTRIAPTLLFELSEIVPLFNGHVLKYTGDGLIAYFAEPSFIRKNDMAIDCALTMQSLIADALNPALTARQLPALQARIGIDAGDAYITAIGSPDTKRHADIIGSVVSLATKIQEQAPPGGIFLGDIAARNLHTDWRRNCKDVQPEGDWPYRDSKGKTYGIQRYLWQGE